MMDKAELEILLNKILAEKVQKGPYKSLTKAEALIRRYVDIGTDENPDGSREGAFLESVLQRILGLGVGGREKAKAAAPVNQVGIVIGALPMQPDPAEKKTRVLDSRNFPPIANAEVGREAGPEADEPPY
jgi:hypothetical protein